MKNSLYRDDAPSNHGTNFQVRPNDATAVAGTYVASRRSESGVRRALNFFTQTAVHADSSGGLYAEGFEFQGASGAARHFVEIAPFVWQELNGHERLAARVQNGRVDPLSVDAVSPFTVFDRVPWYLFTAWLQPALLVGLLLLVGFVLSPLVGLLARKRYGAAGRFQGTERSAYCASVSFALAALLMLALWLSILLTLRFDPLGFGVYLLEIATIVVLPLLCIVGAWFLWTGLSAWTIEA